MSKVAIGEEFSGAIIIMEDYVEEVTKKVNDIFEKFNDCINENTYKVLYDSAKLLEENYNEKVLENIKSSIKEWADGDGSYVSQVKRWKMGDDAIESAQRQQDDIVEKIDSISDIVVISENTQDFSQSHFDPEIVKVNLEDIVEFSKGLEEIVEDKVSELKKLGEENSTIRVIIAVAVTYGKSISTFVQTTTEMASNIISENFERIFSENEEAEEVSKEESEKKVQEMEECSKNLDAIFESLFE